MNKDKIPAAMYIRMSTEHQKYSPENQAAAIREYAERNNYEIIKTYTDGGKSGLNIAGRAALRQMLKDVQSHQAEYKAILVLDVTRWGRFQDADESAYYEYICKRAGTPVKYCNEQFDNDGSPVATIVKGVKRTMAAEYIGYDPERDYSFIEINRFLRGLHKNIFEETIGKIQEIGGDVKIDAENDLLNVNDYFSASIVICRCKQLPNDSLRWKVRFDTSLFPDITIAVRMSADNKNVLDYYLLPALDFRDPKLLLSEQNKGVLDSYRFPDLSQLFEMARRNSIRYWEAA